MNKNTYTGLPKSPGIELAIEASYLREDNATLDFIGPGNESSSECKLFLAMKKDF